MLKVDTPAELKAILENKHYMAEKRFLESIEKGIKYIDVTIEEAILDFAQNHKQKWWKEYESALIKREVEELKRQKFIDSERAGRDLGPDTESRNRLIIDYINQGLADRLRKESESFEKNGFAKFSGTVPYEFFSPGSILEGFYCCAYITKLMINHFNFSLIGRNYADAMSAADIGKIILNKSEPFEIVLFGMDSGKAKDKLEKMLCREFANA